MEKPYLLKSHPVNHFLDCDEQDSNLLYPVNPVNPVKNKLLLRSNEKSQKQVSNHWKNHIKSFQSLEKSGEKFPIIGKMAGFFSNHWKNRGKSFQ
ncbi:MAG: hypothetical protein EOM20_09620 [Spartobacteria bacterium]|nr:hypothetical protein [Spartobacteria bacterium]